jgi:hypothetical protein
MRGEPDARALSTLPALANPSGAWPDATRAMASEEPPLGSTATSTRASEK